MPKQNFNEKLTVLLKTHPEFLDDTGELIPAAVRDHAWQLNHDLIKLLLTDDEIKATFFDEIDGHWVFNHNTFINYITDKNFLANAYTQFRNKIGLNIGGKFLRERGEVSLVWPYKDCVLEGGQMKEEEKRKEIFFNETLAQDEINRMFDPKVLTHWKRHTAEGEQDVTDIQRDENGTIRENLIVKGNNLIALHTLKQQFRGQVKLIYIDPPYNTGSDSFGYNDNFNHSSWLTFMRNRLEVARDLLKDDGIILIHIDDQEMHYLKVVADDIFDRDNFIATVPRKTRSGKSDVPYKLSQDFDWMLMYTKGASKKDNLFQRDVSRRYHKTFDFPDDEWRLSDLTTQRTIHERPNSDFTLVNPRNGEGFPVNPNRCWGITKDSVDEYLRKGKIVFPGDYDFLNIKRPSMRVFKSEDIGKMAYVSSDFLNQVMDELLKSMVNSKGTDEIVEIFGRKAFAYPKNELLMQRIIVYCHRFFRPHPKGRLCYNTISLERSYPMAKRRKFTPEFKAEVVLEVLSGATSQAEVCRRHNLNENQLSQWKRQLLENASTLFDSTDKQSSDAEQRIAHLEQLVGRLTVALDIQKKALDWLK